MIARHRENLADVCLKRSGSFIEVMGHQGNGYYTTIGFRLFPIIVVMAGRLPGDPCFQRHV